MLWIRTYFCNNCLSLWYVIRFPKKTRREISPQLSYILSTSCIQEFWDYVLLLLYGLRQGPICSLCYAQTRHLNPPLRCVHTDKNLVVRLGTTWLCDIKRVVVGGWYGRRVSCNILCYATKIVNRQMSVHFKRNSCHIMVSQRCCVLSDVIWIFFCHFLRCSRAKFIQKIVDVRRWLHNHFLHDHDTFYAAQPCCTKLYD